MARIFIPFPFLVIGSFFAFLVAVGATTLSALNGDCGNAGNFKKLGTLAREGNTDAMSTLGECYFGGQGVAQDDKEAFRWFRAAARKGSASGMCNLGLCFLEGRYTAKNVAEAVRLFRAAADQGYAGAMFKLGEYYRSLGDSMQNAAEAKRWFEAAADLGNTDAMNAFGDCYRRGTGLERNVTMAIMWYRASAEKGSAIAVDNLLAVAATGNADSMISLADCFLHGHGVSKNEANAFKWYRSAAENGHGDAFDVLHLGAMDGNADAMYNLGSFFADKRHVAANDTTALLWYGAAAAMGHVDAIKDLRTNAVGGNAEAMFHLGEWYGHLGTRTADLAAFKWYHSAAEKGNVIALKKVHAVLADGNVDVMFYLAECYFYGHGVPRNAALAYKWYRTAAENGHGSAFKELDAGSKNGNADAMAHLGTLYYDGRGVQANLTAAFQWYRAAASKGHQEAMQILRSSAERGDRYAITELAKCYLHGHGLPKETATAYKWFLTAAENGHADAFKELYTGAQKGNADAMTHLGTLYYVGGQGTPANLTAAFQWYSAAAGKGHQEAKQHLLLRADEGNADAMVTLAEFYMKVPKDRASAYRWYRTAAAKGHTEAWKVLHDRAKRGDVDALYALCATYHDGRGGLGNTGVASFWFRRATGIWFVRDADASLDWMIEEIIWLFEITFYLMLQNLFDIAFYLLRHLLRHLLEIVLVFYCRNRDAIITIRKYPYFRDFDVIKVAEKAYFYGQFVVLSNTGFTSHGELDAAIPEIIPETPSTVVVPGAKFMDKLQTRQDPALTALASACKYGDVAAVERLLAAGMKHMGNNIGMCALALASANGHLGIVDLLLTIDMLHSNYGLKESALEEATKHGHGHVVERLLVGSKFGLVWACECGILRTVERLLAEGMEIRNGQHVYINPYVLAAALVRASHNGHLQVVERLIAAGAKDVERLIPMNAKDGRPLIEASTNGHVHVVERLLAAGLGRRDIDNAVTAAIKGDHPKVVEKLIAATFLDEHGQSVVRPCLTNSTDGSNSCAATLEYASKHGHVSLVNQVLARYDLLAYPRESLDRVIVFRSGEKVILDTFSKAFLCACESGHLDVVNRLLAAGVMFGNVRDFGDQPLLMANKNGHVAVVARLLMTDAYLSADKHTALHYASRHGFLAVVERLLKAGANVHTQNDQALRSASENGHVFVLDRLVVAGANVHVKNEEALRLASANGHLPVVELLLAADADVTANDFEALKAACKNEHIAVADRLLVLGEAELARVAAALASLPWWVNGNSYLPALRKFVQEWTGESAWYDEDMEWLKFLTALWNSAKCQALISACEEGRVLVVEQLLKVGVDVNAGNSRALREASKNGQVEVVERLLAAGADVHTENSEALREASKNGHLEVVERLLAADADVLCADEALPRASEVNELSLVKTLMAAGVTTKINEALLKATQNGHLEVVQQLLTAGPDVHTTFFDQSLIVASENGSVGILEQLLAAGGNVNAVALEVVVRRNDIDAVRLLLATGADVHKNHDESLRTASENGHAVVVQMLLKAGAVVQANNDESLRSASKNGHAVVVEMLLHARANVHVCDNESLRSASTNGHATVVETLLAAGANVNANDDESLCQASWNGHHVVVKMLLAAGADVHVSNDQPLHLASENGHATVVQLLLAAGANVRAANNLLEAPPGHYRPLHLRTSPPLCRAIWNGHVAVVEMLLAAGADVHAADVLSFIGDSRETDHASIRELRIRHGANIATLDWKRFSDPYCRRLVTLVSKDQFLSLPDDVRPLWLRFNLRPRLRLQRALRRARDRLDRPPTAALGTTRPTRDELISHLRTAGRRFAREYWTDGIPLFLPALQVELGPLPDEFLLSAL